jgi:hypothetical protein
MPVEPSHASETVGDALDELQGGEGAAGAVKEVGRGGGNLVADGGQEAGIPMAATPRLNQRSVVRGVDPSWPTVSSG